MQVTETLSDGLKRELAVVVPAADLDAKLQTYLAEMSGKARINGFRPGKVPAAHLKKLYGRQAMVEIVNEVVGDTIRQAVADRSEKPAMQPEIEVGEPGMEKVLEGETDLAFTLRYEVLPEIAVGDVASIAVEEPFVEVTDEEVDAEVTRLADSMRPFEAKDGAAADGDKVTIDFVGKLDGEPFENGSAEGADLVLGSNQFIPGFEEQLVGTSAGDEKVVSLTFPEEYPAQHLAGKAATFDVKVTAVQAPGEVPIDDALAARVGLTTLDELKEAIRQQIGQRYKAASRQKVKRALLDSLDAMHPIETPAKLVESEFEAIWRQLMADMERTGRSFTDEETTEEKAREEYQGIAARRVRLGLVLSKIGEDANVDVTDEEVQGALRDRLRQFPGREKEVIEFYRKNPTAIASLKGPLYEEKVVDHLLGLAQVTRKPVTKEELFADAEDDEAAAG
jgi:trigger factor